jgi:hypothetical protein
VTRLYAATGDAFARLDEAGEAWTVELSLAGSGARCLAVDPAAPDTVFVGLQEGGVHRSADGGRSWVDCELPEPAVFSLAVSAADGAVYAGTEPSRLFRSDDKGEGWRELKALLELPSQPPGASRRGRGRRTCAGSRRARTTEISSWSGSNSAA